MVHVSVVLRSSVGDDTIAMSAGEFARIDTLIRSIHPLICEREKRRTQPANPLHSRKTSARSSVDRAPDFGSGGRGFESLRARHTKPLWSITRSYSHSADQRPSCLLRPRACRYLISMFVGGIKYGFWHACGKFPWPRGGSERDQRSCPAV